MHRSPLVNRSPPVNRLPLVMALVLASASLAQKPALAQPASPRNGKTITARDQASGAAAQPATSQTASSQAGPGQAGPGQSGPGSAGPGQADSGQAGPGSAGPGQLPPGQTAPGQTGSTPTAQTELAATRDLGCIPLSDAKSEYTPPDLFKASRACVDEGRYDTAAYLFTLASIYGRFDAVRVADKTAAPGVQILVSNFGAGMKENQKSALRGAMEKLQRPDKHTLICTAIASIGPPDYIPSYLILHGAKASTQADPLANALSTNFDRKVTWTTLLHEGLRCSV